MTSLHRIALLLLLMASEIDAYATASLTARMTSSNILSWFRRGDESLVCCLSFNREECVWREWLLSEESMRQEKAAYRSQRIPLPWDGATEEMYLVCRKRDSGEVDSVDVSSLNPKGRNTTWATLFDSVHIKFSIECTHGFYGSDCLNACTPRKNHHSCDSNGGYICAAGRSGSVCQHGSRAAAADAAAEQLTEAEAAAIPDSRMTFFLLVAVVGTIAFLVIFSLVRRFSLKGSSTTKEVEPLTLVVE